MHTVKPLPIRAFTVDSFVHHGNTIQSEKCNVGMHKPPSGATDWQNAPYAELLCKHGLANSPEGGFQAQVIDMPTWIHSGRQRPGRSRNRARESRRWDPLQCCGHYGSLVGGGQDRYGSIHVFKDCRHDIRVVTPDIGFLANVRG